MILLNNKKSLSLVILIPNYFRIWLSLRLIKKQDDFS